MRKLKWAELRRTAKKQLFAYRQNALTLRRISMDARAPSRVSGRRSIPPAPTRAELAEMQFWKSAIDSARDAVRKENPQLEQFMVRYFAIRVPKNRRQSESMRHIKLASELHVSESTLYRWQDRILQQVMLSAMQLEADGTDAGDRPDGITDDA